MFKQNRSILNKVYSRITKRFQKIEVEGIPKGLTFEEIDELCLQLWNDHLAKVAYVHLSAWKAAGCYQLLIKTKRGKKRRIIYKNAIYNIDHIPALKGLPVVPGLPEYLVYKNTHGELAKYLPDVYLVKEVISKQHYKYFLEDLSQEYFKTAVQPEITLNVVQEIPALHRAINNTLPEVDQSKFLLYGKQFSLKIQEYFQRNIEIYLQKTDNKKIHEIYKLWPQISKLHIRQEFQDLQTSQLIHGDLNVSNILINKRSPDKIKFIDWEWAGFANAHADLASLLNGSQYEIENRALEIFAAHNTQLSFDQHRRLYQWCQLERGLLNAAFIAVQRIESFHQSEFLLSSKFIESSINQVFKAYQKLA